MRLIHVTPSYLPAVRYGGPIVSVHGLCSALAARGHDVEVFTTSIDGPGDSPVPHDEPVTLDGVTIRYFASPAMRRLYWAPALATALRAKIGAADIVHLHSVFLWPTAAAARLARRRKTLYVLSPRGMLVEELIARRNRLVKTLWLRLIERRNLEGAAAVHVTSTVEAAELGKFPYRLRQVQMIPNGTAEPVAADLPDPPADLAKLAEMRPLLLVFGRLSWTKRLDRLLKAFAGTARGNLAIVGTDDEGLAPRLAAMAEDLGIAGRVHLVPRTVSGEEKEFVFAAASVLVLASLSESFGNVGIEAMQRGLAVITTPNTGVSELVVESGGGILIDPELTGLAGAIDRLARDPALAARLGAAGRNHVQGRYRWADIAERMEMLYRSLLDRASPAFN
jgi:glycosyltransferase involved in cell wall biosynthesis